MSASRRGKGLHRPHAVVVEEEAGRALTSGESVRGSRCLCLCLCRSAHPVGHVVELVVEQTGVDVQRHRRTGMSEYPLYRLHCRAGRHGRAGGGLAQVMRSQRRQPCPPDSGVEDLMPEVAYAQRSPVLRREEPVRRIATVPAASCSRKEPRDGCCASPVRLRRRLFQLPDHLDEARLDSESATGRDRGRRPAYRLPPPNRDGYARPGARRDRAEEGVPAGTGSLAPQLHPPQELEPPDSPGRFSPGICSHMCPVWGSLGSCASPAVTALTTPTMKRTVINVSPRPSRKSLLRPAVGDVRRVGFSRAFHRRVVRPQLEVWSSRLLRKLARCLTAYQDLYAQMVVRAITVEFTLQRSAR